MKSSDIRSQFIQFFERHGHRQVSSSSLIPENDPTLLFANAGMNQFKNAFLGHEKRDYNRAVTSQKCVRAGGKHNDLENVGHTARHHTFFEMLGNFSFGDYFKKDAIHFAWDLLTKDFAIPRDKLYVTVYQDDDEAADIWHKQESVPRERIFRFGQKDNFWRMGDTGPCGPCSEIFYDHGEAATGCKANPLEAAGEDRYVEIWNLVFMQFNEDEKGVLHPLPKPSVDTGSGLERVTAALQGRVNNYETDLFWPLIERAMKISGQEYVLSRLEREKHPHLEEVASAMRVLADHTRAVSFLIADGVLPSNEGRGYVLRRILRRAIRYGRKLSDAQSFLSPMSQTLIETMSGFYPELRAKSQIIQATIADEEQRFLQTLDQGTHILNEALNKTKGTLDGELAFRLYDTFGFPLDLTQLMAKERGVQVDTSDFEKRMEAARAKAKASWKGKASTEEGLLIQLSQQAAQKQKATEFVGYKSTSGTGKVLLLAQNGKNVEQLKAGETGLVIVDRTPFYGEGGGQAGDVGVIRSNTATAEVGDTTKTNDIYMHHVHVTAGALKLGDTCELQVLESKRRATANNHSATHLLHAALRKVLGSHVSQAGSLVDADRLRFDFTHNKPLSDSETLEIEALVNDEISKSIEVSSQVTTHKEAVAAGALALFGEKYGDEVRVIKMGDFSTELCGGTHVSNTSQIRAFTILSESGVSAGVRRIEGITGDRAVQYLSRHTAESLLIRKSLGLPDTWAALQEDQAPEQNPGQSLAQHSAILAWIEKAKQDVKRLEREIKTLQGQKIDVDALLAAGRSFTKDGQASKAVMAQVDIEDRQVLSELADKLKNKVQSGIVVLVGRGEGNHPIIVSVSKNLTAQFGAGSLLKEVAGAMGGKGGGRPDFAQGAAPDLSQASAAFEKVAQMLGVTH